MPKALVHDERGGWLQSSVAALTAARCAPVIVVLGAQSEDARALVETTPGVVIVVAHDWESGMSASLRAGLAAAGKTDAAALLITLVDLPALTSAALDRVVGVTPRPPDLRQATYGGEPGHPVLVGRDHWAALAASVRGDSGGRGYLAWRGAERVDCTDLGGGTDVDGPFDGLRDPRLPPGAKPGR
ncbi:MAG: hypothetical protein RI885_1287 [Actinomycetota bacterium]|jgi:molybdenum cofactor cytidylyltransferase